jgi:signal transduction histidine kinase
MGRDQGSGRRKDLPALTFKLLVVSVSVCGLAGEVYLRPGTFLRPNSGHFQDLVFWVIAVATVELLPVPVSRVLRLSLSFPILIGVAIIYSSPLVAAAVAFVGSFDPRELRREVPALTALFNRSQLALTLFTASVGFHHLASAQSGLQILVPAALLAAALSYCVNVALVVSFMRLVYHMKTNDVLARLRVGAFSEFLLNYLALGFVGVVIAKLYSNSGLGVWSVVAFILPLIFARQMFFRSMALEEAGKELKDRERVLRALSNRMAEERQDERMQIAAYLHDDLAQMLFRLTLQVEMAKKRLLHGEVEAVSRDLDGITATKQQTSEAIRALIRDLHRSPIGRKGLAEAIQSFAEDISRGHPTRITTNVVEVSLPPPIQLLIYQIAREAAMNALKHAEAATISITLSERDDGVELQIVDDGKGFDTDAAPPEGHFGSVMMRERALVAGGTYAIRSEPGAGTSVSATFPRVWVEEGSLLEAQDAGALGVAAASPARMQKPPVGSTVGPPRLHAETA